MSKLGKQVSEVAVNNYRSKMNCAEAIVTAFDEVCNLGIGTSVKLASGFGGGMGHAGDVCGALSGAIMVLGAFKGRPHTPEGSREEIYGLSKGFHTAFVEKFGATDCDVLRKFDFGTREQGINCLKLISSTAELLGDFLVEQKVVQE
jgi:C_GCAxxG_C_C family probable redox protein